MNAYGISVAIALSLLTSLWENNLHAQQDGPKAEIDPRSIKFDRATLPRSVASGRNRNLSDGWHKVEATFATDAGSRRAGSPIVPELTIRCYVAGRDVLNDNQVVVLYAEETFTNVPNDRNHTVTFYLHPMTLQRYGGGRDAAGIVRESNALFELVLDGQVVDTQALKATSADWPEGWTGMGSRVEGILMSVTESPWWPEDFVKYNQIKARR